MNEYIETSDYYRLKKAEKQVIDYILSLTDNQIGAGENPIEFLIASHGALSGIIDDLKEDLCNKNQIIDNLENEIYELKMEMIEANER